VRSDEQTSKSDKVDPRLQSVIENIFARCIDEREYKQVCCVDDALFPHILSVV
jgi:hypothetical protein